MFVRSLATVLSLAVLTPVWADDVYKLTPQNTKVTFVGAKANGKHEGGFKTVKGAITLKDGDLAKAEFKVEIDINSMFTDNTRLTNHLKAPDFFDAKRFPTAKFVTTEVVKTDAGYDLKGKLTLHGETKDLTMPAKLEASSNELTLESNFEINRHDWKISYGQGQIQDMVKLTVKVKAKKS